LLGDEEFEKVCFDFGLELEFPEEGAGEDAEIAQGECKVEVAANRYDLLSVEGLAINLSRFLQLSELPSF
jgi:phenylalanyl-tRNA synthetase beta chain